MEADADEEEREGGRDLADDRGGIRVAGQEDQRERHDREPAELDQRTEPDERDALPAEHGAMVVRPEADQRPERREEERQATP
jgi:hypothetical protein